MQVLDLRLEDNLVQDIIKGLGHMLDVDVAVNKLLLPL